MNQRMLTRPALRSMVALASLLACLLAQPVIAGGPVEYVKICSSYGTGYHYHPGTDTCFNASINDARVETEGGTWRWRMPANPQTMVPAAKKACKGRLVELGNFVGSQLTLNAWTRYQTPALPVPLEEGEYVSSIIFKGGFGGDAGRGSFCIYWHFLDPIDGPSWTPLGCQDTGFQIGSPASYAFVPDAPLPPATSEPISLVGAGGERWNTPVPETISGSVAVSLCLQKGKD